MNSEIFYENPTLFFYASVIIVPFSILLNLIQIKVFKSKEFKKFNIGFLMNTLIILESIASVWSIIVFKYLTSIGINISSLSNLTCVTFLYLVRIIQEVPLYYQTFISFINYLSIKYPYKYKYLCQKKSIIHCLIGIIIFNSIINIPNLFRNIQIQNRTQYCIAKNELDMISSIDFALFRFLIPFIIFIIINSLTLKLLIRLKRNLNYSSKKVKRFAFVLIALSLVFCLFNFPLCCIVIVQIIYQYFIYSNSSQLDHINSLIDYARILAWSYYGFGIFINILCNRRFRKILIKLFKFK